MMPRARHCIVCGKPIPKATVTIYFKEAAGYKREPGTREESYGGYMVAIYVAERPRTKAEAQRHVNQPIVSVRRLGEYVSQVGVWDGESFASEYFHSNECAIRQGLASAQHGHRYKWASPNPETQHDR